MKHFKCKILCKKLVYCPSKCRNNLCIEHKFYACSLYWILEYQNVCLISVMAFLAPPCIFGRKNNELLIVRWCNLVWDEQELSCTVNIFITVILFVQTVNTSVLRK